MKRGIIIAAVIIVLFSLFIHFANITGNVAQEHTIGPSQQEQNCMMQCMGCSSIGVNCTGNQENCMSQCNAKKPESTQETACMESCVLQGCTEFDFSCQSNNQEKCEKECNMIKEPEAKSAEETCIRECVKKVNPELRCQASQEGETGNSVCKECAKSCEHLYAGPCLDDEKLKAKQRECETCEHCYGEPVMGDSGEGWQCITGVECKDASDEFGDNPGTGPGIAKTVTEGIGNIVEGIGNFFKNLFGSSEEKLE